MNKANLTQPSVNEQQFFSDIARILQAGRKQAYQATKPIGCWANVLWSKNNKAKPGLNTAKPLSAGFPATWATILVKGFPLLTLKTFANSI